MSIQPKPKFGLAVGASRGMRGGTVGDAVQSGYREGTPNNKTDSDKKPKPLDKSDKIKPEAIKTYLLSRGKT